MKKIFMLLLSLTLLLGFSNVVSANGSIYPSFVDKQRGGKINEQRIFDSLTVAIYSDVDMHSVKLYRMVDLGAGDEIEGIVVKTYVDSTYGHNTNAMYFEMPEDESGAYYIRATDVSMKQISTWFWFNDEGYEVDFTKPEINIKYELGSPAQLNFSDDMKVKESYVLSSDGQRYEVTNGMDFYQTYKKEGHFELFVVDMNNNVASEKFTIDKTKPVITGAEMYKNYTGAVTLTLSDNLNLSHLTVNHKKQNIKLVNGQTFTVKERGNYEIHLYDNNSNFCYLYFNIDAVGPIAKDTVSNTYLENNKHYNHDVKIKMELVGGVKDSYLKYTDLKGKTKIVSEDKKCTKEGKYELFMKDGNGRTKTYVFHIDKTAPKVTGVKNKKIYTSKSLKIKSSDANLSSIKLNDKKKSKSMVIKKEGNYTLVVSDKAGNTVKVKFTLDRTKPKCTVKNNKTYKGKAKVWGSDSVSGLKSVKLDGKTIKKQTTVKKKGKHQVILTDKAGNKSTINFVIN